MAISARLEASENLVRAYRTWADEIKVSLKRPDSVVFMDDLSNVSRDGAPVDWQSIFNSALASRGIFSDEDLLKIKQSLAFDQFMLAAPTKETILACGGEFELISEKEVASLGQQIAELEHLSASDSIDLESDPIAYADSLISSGMEYLTHKMPWLQGITTKISYLNPKSPFGAQVVTDNNGDIVCELRVPDKLNPKFIDTLIHEFLGHVLHFTQLKRNDEIQTTSPHLLCLTLHTHEPFFIEGIAQVMSLRLLHGDWSFRGKSKVLLENAKFRRTTATVSLVLSQVFEGSVKPSEAGKIHCHYSGDPSEKDRFDKVYEQTLKDLFVSKIRLNYHQALMAVEPLLGLDDVKFFGAMNELLLSYYTPQSLREFVSECLA